MSDRPHDDSAPGSASNSGWRSSSAGDPSQAEPPAPQPETPAADSPWKTVEKRDSASWQRVTEREKTAEPAEEAEPAEPKPAAANLWRKPEGEAAAESTVTDDEAEAPETTAEAEPADAEIIPFDEEAAEEPFSDTLELEDEDEEDSFSMSELMALASLAEAAPAVPVEEAAPEEAPGLDPAEYARQQMDKLRGGVAVTEPEAPAEAVETAPPAEPEPAPEPLTTSEQELAKRFHEAETRIRALREQYRNGQISKEQLQEALKQEMVLDEDEDVWWMMGVESDQWYRYDDDSWQIATPAVLAKEQALAAVSEHTLQSAPVEVSPPFEEMPLPKQVPVTDLDATIPGTQGLFLDPANQATVPSPALTDATIAAVPAATIPSAVPTVPSPYVPPAAPATPGGPSYEDAVKAKRKRMLRTGLIFGGIGLGALLLMGACGLVLGFTYYNSLVAPFQTQIAALADYTPTAQTVRVFSDNGTMIAELLGANGGDREPVNLQDVSPYMVHATLSMEDPTFFQSQGCSALSLFSTFVNNLFGGIPPGTSIEEQLARNLVVQPSGNTSVNPMRDMAIACELNQQYSKDELLQLYLNETYFANQTYGAQAAAQFYFDIGANVLNIAQSALLAGMIDAPALYDPVINRDASFARMDETMQVMAQTGCINLDYPPYNGQPFCISEADLTSGQTTVDKARVEAGTYTPREQNSRYPQFVNYVLSVVEQAYPGSEMYQRGFQIHTTLNIGLQDTAQAALVSGVASTQFTGVNTGAVLVSDPRSGAILAMVGSPNVNDPNIDGQVNQAFTWQMAGGAVMPVGYTAALEGLTVNGQFTYMTPASILWDVPTTYPTSPPYTPINATGQYFGAVPLRAALANNLNVSATKAISFTGLERWVETAQRMGVRFLPDAQFGIPSATGTNSVRLFDMQQAYSTLANGGNRVALYPIVRIADATGAAVANPPTTPPTTTVQPQIAFLMQNILADNQARSLVYGQNSPLNLPEFAGRVGALSGTSDGSRDLWTLGFSTNRVVGVWMGNINDVTTSSSGMAAAAPVWNAVMRAALSSSPPSQFANPGGIVQAQVCSATGAVFQPDQAYPCPAINTEMFVQAMPPPSAANAFIQNTPIDSWSGLIATQYCPDNAITRLVLLTNDPTAAPWVNSPAGASYAASVGLQPPNISPPAGECTPSTQNPVIGISSPAAGQTVSGAVQINGQATAGNFNRYQLEVAPANSGSFGIFYGPVGTPVQNGLLGQWDTSGVPNGAYDLRLTMFSSTGGTASRTVSVLVNNVVPTLVPTPLPIFTPSPLPPVDPLLPIATLPMPIGPTPTIQLGP